MSVGTCSLLNVFCDVPHLPSKSIMDEIKCYNFLF
jgi:hypothetical protein